MQVVFDITNLDVEQITHVEAIISLQKTKRAKQIADYESMDFSGPLTAKQPESNQPTLPFDGEIDTTLPAKKVSLEKKPRAKRTETASEATNIAEEVSEPTQEVKTSSVSLQEVKELAQAMVAKHDRESVKAIISVYGEKLTEVKESDYQNLFDALSALND